MIVSVTLLNENVFLYTPITPVISELSHLAYVNINVSQYDSPPPACNTWILRPAQQNVHQAKYSLDFSSVG